MDQGMDQGEPGLKPPGQGLGAGDPGRVGEGGQDEGRPGEVQRGADPADGQRGPDHRDGAASLGPASPAGSRSAETAAFFEFMQAELLGLMDRWRTHRAALNLP